MKMKVYRNISLAIICIILGLMIAWQYKSIHHNQQVATIENKREEDLKDELITEKKTNENLQTKLNELENEIKGYENTQGGNNQIIQNLRSELEKTRMIAGLTDVKGKGLIITIQDGDLFLISDTELLRLLNELKASGTQAISINAVRNRIILLVFIN
ncbi:MAG TPA: DUF881 domain-containing protein, partial [Clostridia bacterium]|nr:DUF881 domain-containing protein [Clostridia bacterium]